MMTAPSPTSGSMSFIETCMQGKLGKKYASFPQVSGPYTSEMTVVIDEHNKALNECESRLNEYEGALEKRDGHFVVVADERSKLLEKALVAAIADSVTHDSKKFRALPPTTQHQIIRDIVVAFEKEDEEKKKKRDDLLGYATLSTSAGGFLAAFGGTIGQVELVFDYELYSFAVGFSLAGGFVIPVLYFWYEVGRADGFWSKIEKLKEAACVEVDKQRQSR